MGYKVSIGEMDEILLDLKERYRVFGPKWNKPHKLVRFSEINSVSEIVLDRQSDFSVKEVFYPVSQVMFYFEGDDVRSSELSDDRDILIFARPCDINSVKRLDNIFYVNGTANEKDNRDYFYARLREKVKFVLLSCDGGFDDCFCASLGTGKTDDYVFAVKPGESWLIDVKDEGFLKCFSGYDEADYTPSFTAENKKKLIIPQITKENLPKVVASNYWESFNDKCIACGGCNTVCGTCSCFDTVDVVYRDGNSDGERRRIWSSCMLESYTETAGGSRFRKNKGDNMRFKVLHKFYDYENRFKTGESMCVGCGRCDMRCPKDISFFDAVNGLSGEM